MSTNYLVQRTCKECDKIFMVRKQEIKRGGGKFCNNSCSAKFLNNARKPVKLICQNPECGKPYLSKNKNSLYCCKTCCNKARYLRTNYYKNTRPQLQRKIIKALTTEHFKCFICNWNEATPDIHHITPKSKGGTNDFDNLTVLCPNHHRLADHNKLNNLPTVSDRCRTISSPPS